MSQERQTTSDHAAHAAMQRELNRMDSDIRELKSTQDKIVASVNDISVSLNDMTLQMVYHRGNVERLEGHIEELHDMSRRTLNAVGAHMDAEHEIDLRNLKRSSFWMRVMIWLGGTFFLLAIVCDLIYLQKTGDSLFIKYMHFF